MDEWQTTDNLMQAFVGKRIHHLYRLEFLACRDKELCMAIVCQELLILIFY